MNGLQGLTIFAGLFVSCQALPGGFVPFNTSNLDYPCEEKGVFPHPYACSKYVFCDSKLLAFEKDCPLCTDEANCSGERLNFNPETGLCDLTSDSRCPPTTTTPKPSGNECVPECQQKGDCNCFETCVENPASTLGGYWVKEYCDRDLYWNPEATGSDIHGGVCDFWDNLTPERQQIYIAQGSEKCPTPKCEWKEDHDCANWYFYRPEGVPVNDWYHVECPTNGTAILYWDQTFKTCRTTCNSDSCLTC